MFPTADDRELETLVRTHYAEVWTLCRALVDQDVADDLAQETFIRAGRTLADFRGETTVRAWLLSIARRTCVDELRRRGRRTRRDTELADLRRSPHAEPPGAGLELRDLIGRLDPDRRTAFALTQLLGLSYAEAAQVCDCAVGTIRSRVARAREDLIGLLEMSGRDQRARSGG
jgi:RNA polymerase sigma-70 factor, ECF subfamily